MPLIAGLDGYKGRWVAALEHPDGRTELRLVDSITELLSRSDINYLVIDVPIGLAECGPRDCDRIARARLGPRGASVFPAPLRPMLSAATHREASQIRIGIEGKGCSIQAASIIPLIRSVDAVMNPALQAVVREGHPELSFSIMSGAPMKHPKRKLPGREERLALVRQVFEDAPEVITGFGRSDAITDILDAYAMLWSARRLRDGAAETIPGTPVTDARGLRMEMVV
jgi:predicted RNase H-like nuclease